MSHILIMDQLVEAPINLATQPDSRAEFKAVSPELVKALRSREMEIRRDMSARYGINSPDYRPFHGEDPLRIGHINRVALRSMAIMTTFHDAEGPAKSFEEERERGEELVFSHYIGLVHDGIQDAQLVLALFKDGKPFNQPIAGDFREWIGKETVKLARAVGPNEENTINRELEWMDQVDADRVSKGLQLLFTEKHRNWLRRSITVSVPGWNGATVFQPNLKEGDDRLTHAMAWGDLKGGIFMDGFRQFQKEGDLNLLEDNRGLLEVVRYTGQFSPQIWENMGGVIRKWRSDQVPFAEAQWDQLQTQIVRFPKAEAFLRERNFREDIYRKTYQKIKQRAKRNESTSDIELLKELKGYVLTEQAKYPKLS